MKKSFTLFSNAMDRLGESNTFLKCAFCFVAICLATALAAAFGMIFGTMVAKVFAAITCILTILGSIALYPHLWSTVGPRLDAPAPMPEAAPIPVRLVKSTQ